MNQKMGISAGVKASVVYTIASFITKGISFITVPIFTRIMSTSEIGIATTYSSWMSILGVIAALGINTGAYNMAMNEFKNERDYYTSSALATTTIAAGIIGILYLIFFNYLNSAIGVPWQMMVLMLIGFVVQPATDLWMIRQRYEYKYMLVSVISIGTALASSILAVVCVLIAKNAKCTGLGEVKIVATYIVYDMVALALLIYQLIRGKAVIKKKYVKFALKVSLPMMVHSLAKHILDVSDKIMIQYFCGNSAVGIYGTLFTLSTLSLILWNAINASLVPFMFTNMCVAKKGEERINGVITPVILVYGMASILLALVSPEVVSIIAPVEYYEAIYLMPPVAAGIFLTSIYNIMGNILLYHGKSAKIMAATLAAATINIVLNALFIPQYGYMAAAYTTLFANVFLAFSQFIMARRQHGKLPLNSRLLWTFSSFITVSILLCNILYKFTVVRYVIIICVVALVVIKRRFFVDTMKKVIMKGK